MNITPNAVLLHRGARARVIDNIIEDVGSSLLNTRVEKGSVLEPPAKHVWTTLLFCPFVAEAAWVVAHSSYKFENAQRTTGTGTYDLLEWDFWNMGSLENALKLFRYLNTNKNALEVGKVMLADTPETVPGPIISPLRRADHRAALCAEFYNAIRVVGHRGRLPDVILSRMMAFVRGATIDRDTAFDWETTDQWYNTATAFVRTISTDTFSINPMTCQRLREKARRLLDEERAGAQ